MRQLICMSLLVTVAACDLDRGTRPESTVINVRVRDDRGAPVGRTQVSATLPATTRVKAQTRSDGTADILVADAGIYRVWVVPREGYLASDALSKSVTVATNAKAAVDFTLYRAGSSNPNPPIEW